MTITIGPATSTPHRIAVSEVVAVPTSVLSGFHAMPTGDYNYGFFINIPATPAAVEDNEDRRRRLLELANWSVTAADLDWLRAESIDDHGWGTH